MKLSVSLSDDDVAVLDAYVRKTQLPSRSAGLQRAIHMLRYPDLEDEYARAWNEWEANSDSVEWDGAVGDGVTDAAR